MYLHLVTRVMVQHNLDLLYVFYPVLITMFPQVAQQNILSPVQFGEKSFFFFFLTVCSRLRLADV